MIDFVVDFAVSIGGILRVIISGFLILSRLLYCRTVHFRMRPSSLVWTMETLHKRHIVILKGVNGVDFCPKPCVGDATKTTAVGRSCVVSCVCFLKRVDRKIS